MNRKDGVVAGLVWRALPAVFLVGLGCCLIRQPVNSELLNGSFDQPLTVGWQTEPAASSEVAYERGDTFGQPRSGQAVKVTREGQGYAQLSQVVELPDLYYVLKFDARFSLGGGLSCNPTARILVSYLDQANRELGRSEWYLPALDSSRAGSDTCRYRLVTSADAWISYTLDIHEELSECLGGINRDQVKRLRIAVEPGVESSG